jgi:hypothetical protein
MAKHFGMRFVYHDGREVQNIFGGSNRLIIHSGSLRLLEPVIGDLLLMDDNDIGHCTAERITKEIITGRPKDYIEMNGFWAERQSLTAIIQRNGIPFHWPETQE